MRFLIPLTRQDFFTLEDLSLLQSLCIDPLWVIEMSLHLWLLFAEGSIDDIYETIMDDVTYGQIGTDDSPETLRRQRMLSEYSDQFVGMMRRVYEQMRRGLRDMPQQIPPERFESVTLVEENPSHGYVVVAINQADN